MYILYLKNRRQIYYNLSDPRPDPNSKKSVISRNYKPRHKHDLSEYNVQLDNGYVPLSLLTWIEMLRMYDNLSLDPTERFVNRQQEEYYTKYEVLEEDANTAPFDFEQRKLLTNTL